MSKYVQILVGIIMAIVGVILFIQLPYIFGYTIDFGDGILLPQPRSEYGIIGLVILLFGLGIARTAK
ncbi:hypothetical protein E4H12_04210 [Candidatus Thorarchaeota archaeon]|jgi:hypothetical protein|nr:MAG: hypothetical protein E4H12_04210 [Candidatus Thorarchaeota archaeon]